MNIPKMKHKVMIPVHNNNFMCPKKSIQSLQKVSHSAAYLKAFENCYQMEKLHCSSENNTENQNKYFILIIINLKEFMFFSPFHSSHLFLFDISKNGKAITYFDQEFRFKTYYFLFYSRETQNPFKKYFLI